MAWTTPEIDALIEQVTNDLVTRLRDTTARIPFSSPWAKARAFSGAVIDLYGFAQYLAKQVTPLRATDEYLEWWAATKALTRAAAVQALGHAVVEGPIGGTLPAGAEFVDGAGNLVQTRIAVEFVAESEIVPIVASVAGVEGNLDGGASLTMVEPPSGEWTPAATVLASAGCTGGTVSTKATGYGVIYATSGSSVASGQVVETLAGVQYTVNDACAWSGSGERAVAITAVANGTAGNCDPGTYLTVIAPPVGVSAEAYVANDGLAGGLDIENDDDLRVRVLDAFRRPAHGGAHDDYIRWVREVASVRAGSVWPFGYPDLALPNVRVYFTLLGTSPIPTAAHVAAVQTYLNGRGIKPMTAIVAAAAPTPHDVPLAGELHVATGYVRADVIAAIDVQLASLYLQHQLAAGSTYLRNSKIRGAIDATEGIDWYTLTSVDGGSGTADVSLSAYELPVLGTATWS